MSNASVSSPPIIPDYELVRQIGHGSYGDVWLARGVTGHWRAIKVVWRERFADAEPFEREFRGLKEFAGLALGEAGQLALLHVGRNAAAGSFYYVMELADDAGGANPLDPAGYVPLTLAELHRRRGRLPVAECVRIGVELARALAGLHARGLVHRDVKPSNVILVGGVPKLADIGLVAPSSSARTFVGTEGFVPPEGPGGPAADVFALGKVLYELATGVDRQAFPKLPAGFNHLPDRRALLELNEVLLRACEPLPEKRYRDGAALLADLEKLKAGRPVRRFAAWQWVALAVATAGLATLTFVRRSAPRVPPPRAEAPRTAHAAKLVEEARQHYSGVITRAGLARAEETARRATELEPDSPRAWAARAGVEAGYLAQRFVAGEEQLKRARDAKTYADRALLLDPNEAEALVALGIGAKAQGAREQAEGYFRRALAREPDNLLAVRQLASVLRTTGRTAEAMERLQSAAVRFPRDALTHFELGDCYRWRWSFAKAWAAFEAAQQDRPFVRAEAALARLALNWKGDVALMRSILDRVDIAERGDDEYLHMALLCSLLERRPDRLREAAGVATEDVIWGWFQPVAGFLAFAYEFEGRTNLAVQKWREAETALRGRLNKTPNAVVLRLPLAVVLARQGRVEEARREFAVAEASLRERMSPGIAGSLAGFYAACGEAAPAVALLRNAVNQGPGVGPLVEADLRLSPWYDKIRNSPEFQDLLANLPPKPKPLD